MEQEMIVMEWPARSPDPNPIENLWGVLVRRVYRDFRNFSDINELQEAIELAWDAISQDVYLKLLDSMPKRCVEVISKRGGPTHY